MALGPVDTWVEGLGNIHSWQVCVVQGPWVYEESSIRDKIGQESKVKKVRLVDRGGRGARTRSCTEHNMLAGQSLAEGPSSEQARNRTDAKHPGGSKSTWGRSFHPTSVANNDSRTIKCFELRELGHPAFPWMVINCFCPHVAWYSWHHQDT